jgi:hypothetical protein
MDWFYIVPGTSALIATAALLGADRVRNIPRSQLAYVSVLVRVFFGVHLLYSGVRFYLPGAQPVLHDPVAGPFIASLTAMGIFPAIKALEIIVGLFLLANRFVPFMLILEFPSTVVIFYMNTFISISARTLVTGPLELAVHGVLFALYFGYYREIFAIKPRLRPIWNEVSPFKTADEAG